MPATHKRIPCWSSCSSRGGNDYLNTVIPYNNPLYRDNRKAVVDRRQPDHAARQDLRHPVVPGADEEVLGRRQARHHAWRRLPRFAAIAFPLHGHLAHLRARQGRHRGLAGPRGARVRPEEGERGHRRQLRPDACSAPCPCRAFRWRAWPARWSSTASCRASRTKQQRLAMLDRFSRMYKPAIGQRRHGVPRHHRSRLAEGRRHPEGGAGQVQVRREVSRTPRSPGSSRASPRCTSPISARGSSIAITAASTRMPARTRCTRSLWTAADRGPRGVHGRPAGARQVGQRDRAACSRSSAVACATTAPARIMAPPASTFVLGDKVKGGHYGDMPSLDADQARAGRPQPEHGLPQHLLDDSRQVAAARSGADRERHASSSRPS